jgi:peptidoglycan/LPS O-acetylase OafA/YrhL
MLGSIKAAYFSVCAKEPGLVVRVTSARSTSDPSLSTAEVGTQPGTSSTISARFNKLPALTSLRFIAAALIVLHHSQGNFGIARDATAPFVLSQGVSFFFVLSGFILTYVYPTLQDIGKRRFLLARFARIWPAHIAAFALVFALFPPSYRSLSEGYTIQTALAQLFLVHAWIPTQRFYYSFNDVSWSISTEFGFYLCFLLLIHNWNTTWKYKLGLAILIVVGLALFANFYYQENSSPVAIQLQVGLMYIHPLGRLFEFTLGMAAALVWRHLWGKLTTGLLAGTMLELLAIGIALTLMYFSRTWAESAQVVTWIGPAGVLWLMRGGIACTGFALMILVMALQLGVVARFFGHPWLVFLGEISYSVYLVHKILIRYYSMNIWALAPLPEWLAYTVFWISTLLLAYLIWVLIEVPSRTFLVNLWPRRPATASAVNNSRSYWPLGLRTLRARPSIPISALTLLLLFLSVRYITEHRLSIAQIDHAYAEGLAARGPAEAQLVSFGQQFVLVGADISPTENGLRVELAWRSLTTQRLQYYNVIQLRDIAGNVIGRADYPQDQAQNDVLAGVLWHDIVTIPPEKLKGASTLALGLFQPPSSWLLTSNSSPGQNRQWVVIPLPEPTQQ